MGKKLTPKERMYRSIAEKSLMEQFIDLGRTLGWLVCHFHDSRRQVTRNGRTFMVGDNDAKGFPDVFMVRGDRLMAVEVKKELGKTTPEQDEWLRRLAKAGVECHVLRPSNWNEVSKRLRRDAGKP